MPIAIRCPHCSGTMNLKDELAGRTVKCPKCGDAMQLPATAPAPPKPMPPAPLPLDDDEPDERPRPAARRRDDDDDDDEPLRRPRPANRGVLGWVVGGVVGVLVLGGVLYAVLGKSKPDDAGAAGGTGGPTNANVTEANGQRIKSGMTPAEVETILGKGRPATGQDFSDAQAAMNNPSFAERMLPWEPKWKAGEVLAWASGRSRILVGFSRPPDKGGTVVGVVSVIVTDQSVSSSNYLDARPAGGVTAGTPRPTTPRPTTPSKTGGEPIVVSVTDLLAAYGRDQKAADAKYKGQLVRITGVVRSTLTTTITLVGDPDDGKSLVRASFAGSTSRPPAGAKAGDTLSVIGRVSSQSTTTTMRSLLVTGCKLAD